jgi:glycerol-3-phosphate acyltransferase PlsY
MIIAAPFALALSLLTWLAVFSFSRYVSLASIAMCVALPVFAALLGGPFWIILFTILSASLLIYKHKENIRRLVKGEEPKTT